MLLTNSENAIKRTRMIVVQRYKTKRGDYLLRETHITRFFHHFFFLFYFIFFFHLIATCEVIGDLRTKGLSVARRLKITNVGQFFSCGAVSCLRIVGTSNVRVYTSSSPRISLVRWKVKRKKKEPEKLKDIGRRGGRRYIN